MKIPAEVNLKLVFKSVVTWIWIIVILILTVLMIVTGLYFGFLNFVGVLIGFTLLEMGHPFIIPWMRNRFK